MRLSRISQVEGLEFHRVAIASYSSTVEVHSRVEINLPVQRIFTIGWQMMMRSTRLKEGKQYSGKLSPCEFYIYMESHAACLPPSNSFLVTFIQKSGVDAI